MTHQRNWAGNYEFGAQTVKAPRTVGELQESVGSSGKIRALGTRHSFNDIADSPGHLVSLKDLNKVLAIDPLKRTVTVEGGIRYGELCRQLDQHGLALQNLASLPHISVAGAISTATHGSGLGNGNLARAVAGIDVVTADGEIRSFTRDDDPYELPGSVVSLGALGIFARVVLNVVPAFEIAQTVFRDLPFAALEDGLEEVMGSGYSVSLFTDWSDLSAHQVWVKSLVGSEPRSSIFGGLRLAEKDLHPIPELSAENCTPQMGIAGPSFERLPHFKLDFTPSSGQELQSEYFVPFHLGFPALMAIGELRSEITPLLHVSEVRAVAEDDLWMSPCWGQTCLAIHFTWKSKWTQVKALLPKIEAALDPFNPVPHWGKLYTMSPQNIADRYECVNEFRTQVRQYDPTGKFRNAFLEPLLGG